MAHDESWRKIFRDCGIDQYDFDEAPFRISASNIKACCQDFRNVGEKEVRILCKQDTRESRPSVFVERGLFLLPVKNGEYVIVRGEGYVNIPLIDAETTDYSSKLGFTLDTSLVGNSEMQHLDFAYATSVIRTFMKDETLVLTIRGRKYSPEFSFRVGRHTIDVCGVQTEVDAGYEGKKQVVLVEAKGAGARNTIIRQLYYPFRQWSSHTQKRVVTLFFEKSGKVYSIWEFQFTDVMDYNSIRYVRGARFRIGN